MDFDHEKSAALWAQIDEKLEFDDCRLLQGILNSTKPARITRRLSDLGLIYCGKAGFGQIARSLFLKQLRLHPSLALASDDRTI